MSPVQACPSPQKLTDYLLGKLDEAEWQSISDHLHACEDCVSELDQIDESQDSMIQRLRHPQSDDEFMQEPECRLAVEKSRQLDWGQVADFAVLREYQLIEKLGEGGMGTVYRARHTKLDREVAVKLLPSERLRSAQAVSRFEREMKAIGRLHHPNIVQAFDAGEVEGQYYLAMELVSGLDLSMLVDRVGPLPVADACEIVRQAALGLQHAHEHELVHRDIKSSNLMLTPSGDVKILDLGLARLQDPLSEEHEVTSTGQVMGTLDYMAPEQLGDSHAVDIRADIYSLGATLYKLLTGRAPHADKRLQHAPEEADGNRHEGRAAGHGFPRRHPAGRDRYPRADAGQRPGPAFFHSGRSGAGFGGALPAGRSSRPVPAGHRRGTRAGSDRVICREHVRSGRFLIH